MSMSRLRRWPSRSTPFVRIWMVVCCFLIIATTCSGVVELNEEDRLKEYARRQHTWPLLDSEYVPSTDGWRKLLHRRFQQVDRLNHDQESYSGYINTLVSAMSPNYTEYGWGVTRAPTELWQALDAHLHSTNNFLEKNQLEEYEVAINTLEEDQRPLFINIPEDLEKTVLQELQPLMEAWSGVALLPYNAYGLRVYRNTSKLYMHLDSPSTHVISAILHVGHDTNTPWPLVIEDFEGITNEVQLEAGDVLLYESSKCWHGRPRRMDGHWYTSLFVHYYPQQFPVDPEELEWAIHHRVPPHWWEKRESEVDSFEMVDTSCMEPDCAEEWCALNDSKVIKGPAPDFGTVLTAHGKLQTLTVDQRQKHEEL